MEQRNNTIRTQFKCPSKPQEWLNAKDAAKYIGRSVEWLRQCCNKGYIEGKWIFGRKYYDPKDLDALITPKSTFERIQHISNKP